MFALQKNKCSLTPAAGLFFTLWCVIISPAQSLCSGTSEITSSAGTITDGSGWFNYGNNMLCNWWIMPPGANSITFTVTQLDIEAEYDGLSFYTCTAQNQGTCTWAATLWGTPGVAIPFRTWQTGFVLVIFESDYSETRGGFSASWTSSTTMSCPTGYSGSGCMDDNECSSSLDNTCDTNALCINVPGSFTCTCKAGYSGNGRTCVDENECTGGNHNCDENALCTNTDGSYTCACGTGWENNFGIVNFESLPSPSLCTQNSGKCFFVGTRGPAAWSDAENDCRQYEGHLASVRTMSENNIVRELSCDSNSACSSGAVVAVWMGYSDRAVEGAWEWSDGTEASFEMWRDGEPNNAGSGGEDCAQFRSDTEWNDIPCSSQQRYVCSVYPGVNCVDTNECIDGINNCDSNAVCTNTAGSFTCRCTAGYSGTGVSCSDMDECSAGTDNCDSNAACTDSQGSFTCSCNAGYSGTGVACSDIDECAASTDNCDSNAVCADNDGSYTCACNAGWATSDGGVTCLDVIECGSTDNCDDNAECTDATGSFTCSCNTGFAGDGVSCTTDDKCVSSANNNCDANAECFSVPGSFTCGCNAGYSGTGLSCSDIDDCSAGTDNCDSNAACSNTAGSFMCSCNTGYIGGGVSCNAVPPSPCSGTSQLISREGTITDGSAGNDYEDNMDCIWWIMPPGVNTITLTIDELDTESCCDILKVYTCLTQAASTCTLQATLSGTSGLTSLPTWQTGIVMAQFASDFSETRAGFSASWTSAETNNAADECMDGTHVCDANAVCIRNITAGNFSCICNAGYNGDGVECYAFYIETPRPYRCGGVCAVEAECLNKEGSGFECKCKTGYAGDGTECEDIDECSLPMDTCQTPGHSCTNSMGSFECTCLPGWTRESSSLCQRPDTPTNGIEVQLILPYSIQEFDSNKQQAVVAAVARAADVDISHVIVQGITSVPSTFRRLTATAVQVDIEISVSSSTEATNVASKLHTGSINSALEAAGLEPGEVGSVAVFDTGPGPQNSNEAGTNAIVLACAVVGSVFGVVAMVCVGWLFWRKNRRKNGRIEPAPLPSASVPPTANKSADKVRSLELEELSAEVEMGGDAMPSRVLESKSTTGCSGPSPGPEPAKISIQAESEIQQDQPSPSYVPLNPTYDTVAAFEDTETTCNPAQTRSTNAGRETVTFPGSDCVKSNEESRSLYCPPSKAGLTGDASGSQEMAFVGSLTEEASHQKQPIVEAETAVPGMMTAAALEPPEEMLQTKDVEEDMAASSSHLRFNANADSADFLEDKGLLGRLAIRPSALQIGQEIGTGVHGTVRQGLLQYGGRQRQVAVKGLSALGEIDKEAFNAELCAVVRASEHLQGVVRVYGTCLKAPAVGSDREFWLVTELHSQSVADVLREVGGLGDAQVTKYLCQLCADLSQLHSAGIVHQNIKPENLLLNAQDEIVINDFGIAHILNKIPNTLRRTEGPARGTLEYMPPEILASRDAYLQDVIFDPDLAERLECDSGAITPKQDVWSLAVCAVEMLTGRNPFANMTMQQIMIAVIDQRISPDVPGDSSLVPILSRAFAFDPMQRPAISEMLNGLIGLLKKKCVVCCEVSGGIECSQSGREGELLGGSVHQGLLNHGERHFTCTNCLQSHVTRQCQKADSLLKVSVTGPTATLAIPCVLCDSSCKTGEFTWRSLLSALDERSSRSLIATRYRRVAEMYKADQQVRREEIEQESVFCVDKVEAVRLCLLEALTRGQTVPCPSCAIPHRKEDDWMVATCLCGGIFCYACGHPRSGNGAHCPNRCDISSAFLSKQPGWESLGRTDQGESSIHGAVLEFHRRRMARLVRLVKEAAGAEAWDSLRQREPLMLQEVIEGRNISWAEVELETAGNPHFGGFTGTLCDAAAAFENSFSEDVRRFTM